MKQDWILESLQGRIDVGFQMLKDRLQEIFENEPNDSDLYIESFGDPSSYDGQLSVETAIDIGICRFIKREKDRLKLLKIEIPPKRTVFPELVKSEPCVAKPMTGLVEALGRMVDESFKRMDTDSGSFKDFFDFCEMYKEKFGKPITQNVVDRYTVIRNHVSNPETWFKHPNKIIVEGGIYKFWRKQSKDCKLGLFSRPINGDENNVHVLHTTGIVGQIFNESLINVFALEGFRAFTWELEDYNDLESFNNQLELFEI